MTVKGKDTKSGKLKEHKNRSRSRPIKIRNK